MGTFPPAVAYVYEVTPGGSPGVVTTEFSAHGIVRAVSQIVALSPDSRILIRLPRGLSFSQRYFPHVTR